MTDNWETGREAHIRLSNAAASKYDDLYENANFATGSYMKYEIDTIERSAPLAPSKHLAIDLGCGTGRDSFCLGRLFSQVYAYDFSPEMVKVAEKNKIKNKAGNVLFECRDVDDPLPAKNDSVAFVNTAFGMGSFVAHPEKLFREVRRVLSPRGIAIFSFYNSDALVNNLALSWRPALAARVVEGKDALSVDFDNEVFEISAKAYSPHEIKNKLAGNFKVLDITTFPTLSALFPQEIFQHEKARELCSKVDQLLSNKLDIAAGPYIVAVCQKGGGINRVAPSTGYERVLELIRFHDISEDIREHAPVRTMEDVFEVLEDDPARMVKSILVTHCSREGQDIRDSDLFLCGVPADRRLDLGKLAKVLALKRTKLRFASQIEVETVTGFKVGAIPPFGLPKRVPVIVDSSFEQGSYVWCGTGKATESLRLKIEDLKMLSAYVSADISKAE